MSLIQRSLFKLIFPALVCCLGVGCQSGSRLPGETGTVSGKVSYQSAPVPADSIVVMIHEGTGIVATGVTDSAGQFRMNMRGKSDVLVGEYAVHVRPAGEVSDGLNKLTPENVPETWKAIPQKYWSATDSPERFTVKPGSNTYELVLKD